jgi:hypothetical protein
MDPFLEPAPASRNEKKLLDQMRVKHYSLRTERSYCNWVERFIRFHRMRHPRDMGEEEVGAFDSLVAHSLGLSARPVYVAATLTAPFSPIWHVAKTSLPRPKTRL